MRELALISRFNLRLRQEFARSDYFGRYPPRSKLTRLIRAMTTVPARSPNEFVHAGRVNAALKSDSEVNESLDRQFSLGLAPHPDRPKNWDAFRAFSIIITRGTRNASVLDMGCAHYGRILPWLHLNGFRNLYGCDHSFSRAFSLGRIRYHPYDLQKTGYPSAQFDFITCLSVIEHGVDANKYFREASRLLRPGGILLTSTDYWCEPVLSNLPFDETYKADITIFSAKDIESLVDTATRHGFAPIEQIDYDCEEKVVRWKRMNLDFTFLFLAMRFGGAP